MFECTIHLMNNQIYILFWMKRYSYGIKSFYRERSWRDLIWWRTWIDLINIINMSSKALILWYLDLIWLNIGKNFDPLVSRLDLMKIRTLILLFLDGLESIWENIKYLYLVFSLCLMSLFLFFCASHFFFYGFVLYL